MQKHYRSPWSIISLLSRHLLALTIFWIVGFAFVQVGQRALGSWPAAEIGQLLACVLGVVIALRMRAPGVSYLLAAMAAFTTSELAIHLTYGIRAAQGAPTHFAVMGAGVLGVALGALLMRPGGWAAGSGEGALNHGTTDGPSGLSTDGSDVAISERRSNLPLQPAGVRS
jgi:hypothetical protein